MTSTFIENSDSPSRAEGVGEPALPLMRPVSANTIFNATGFRFSESPITPDEILARFKAAETAAGAISSRNGRATP